MPEQIDLTALVPQVAPGAAPSRKVQAEATQIQRGDDIIKAAHELTFEDRMNALEFERASKIIKARAETDNAYAQRVLPKMSKLPKDQLHSFVFDEADNLEIERLEAEDPTFGRKEAAVRGFLDGALLDQVSRIQGTAEFIYDLATEEDGARQKPDWQRNVEEVARRTRLLEKKYPGTDVAGEVASYLLPGSPARMLYSKAAKITGKAVSRSLVKSGIRRGLLKKVSGTALAGAAGAGAVEGVKGFIGEGLEEFSFDRAADRALVAGGTNMIAAGGMTLLGAAASKAGKVLGKTVEQFSGADEQTLRAFGKFGKQIKRQAGREKEIGENLSEIVLQGKNSMLPEVIEAKAILQNSSNFKNVDASRLVNFLSKASRGTNPRQDSQVRLLNEWGNRLKTRFKDIKKVSPTELRKELDTIGQEVSDKFGDREAKFATKMLARAYGLGNAALKASAKQSGEDGQKYIDLMGLASQKRSVLSFLAKSMGRKDDKIAENAERFIKQVVGPNKELALKKLQQLDNLYGTNLAKNAELAGFAKKLDINRGGIEGLLPTQTTGRSRFGQALGSTVGAGIGGAIGSSVGAPVAGAAIGAGVGGAAGTLASGPRGARMLLGTSDAITGFSRAIMNNQQALSGMARTAKNQQVREAAGILTKELKKNGPISMTGVLRMMADTPIFVGLVTSFEVADRARRNKENQQRERSLQQSFGGRR